MRNWQLSDAESAHEIFSDPDTMLPTGSFPVSNMEETVKLVSVMSKLDEYWAIILKENLSIIGMIHLSNDIQNNHNTKIVGFCIAKSYWNQGYLTEALKGVLKYSRKKLITLSAFCKCNPKAEHIFKKCGFKKVKTEKNELFDRYFVCSHEIK